MSRVTARRMAQGEAVDHETQGYDPRSISPPRSGPGQPPIWLMPRLGRMKWTWLTE